MFLVVGFLMDRDKKIILCLGWGISGVGESFIGGTVPIFLVLKRCIYEVAILFFFCIKINH